jgi:hypothetical protein
MVPVRSALLVDSVNYHSSRRQNTQHRGSGELVLGSGADFAGHPSAMDVLEAGFAHASCDRLLGLTASAESAGGLGWLVG